VRVCVCVCVRSVVVHATCMGVHYVCSHERANMERESTQQFTEFHVHTYWTFLPGIPPDTIQHSATLAADTIPTQCHASSSLLFLKPKMNPNRRQLRPGTVCLSTVINHLHSWTTAPCMDVHSTQTIPSAALLM